MDAVKARRKRLGSQFRCKVNRHEDSMFVMIVFVPYGLVSIGLKPSTDRRHRSRKISGA
jgi:hypothetical protein